jgi:cytidyltransferase-like protein
MGKRYRRGCIHGRFQPFHIGHFEYLERAFALSEVLYVGITNYEPPRRTVEITAPHRHTTDANPFSYQLRAEMILATARDAGIDTTALRVTPFPISDVDLLPNYVPHEVVQLVTTYDAWNEEKMRRLADAGYEVVEMWRRTEKVTTGTEVRGCLAEGKSIDALVPKAVARILKSMSTLAHD